MPATDLAQYHALSTLHTANVRAVGAHLEVDQRSKTSTSGRISYRSDGEIAFVLDYQFDEQVADLTLYGPTVRLIIRDHAAGDRFGCFDLVGDRMVASVSKTGDDRCWMWNAWDHICNTAHINSVRGITAAPPLSAAGAFPAGYEPTNLFGNIVEVLHARSEDGEVTKQSIAYAIANHFGDGDYNNAEQVVWDTYVGPLLDDVETDLALDAGYAIRA